jgi:hypothetical protein
MQPQTNLTDHSMGWLGQLPALRYLAIADSPDVTDDGIGRLAQSKSLVSVSIADNPQFSDDSLRFLASRVKDFWIVQPDGDSRRIQSQ